MQLVTIRTETGTRAGRVEGDDVVLLDAADVGALLRANDPERLTNAGGDTRSLASCDLAPVIPSPNKIACVGLNYRSHIEESGLTVPSHPNYFAKFTASLIGPHDPIALPAVSSMVDWEGELVVVIGAAVRHASPAEAQAAIAGFCVMNDVSMRDWQLRTEQWLAGKTFERSTPLGPALVTADEVGDGRGLDLTTTVNGTVRQKATTSDLVFGPVDLVADLSTVITLEPGDVIATGTPGGVGLAASPPTFLAAGDEVRVRIADVGELVNRCEPDG
jgi:acylpyruvate hydrolase